MSTLHPCIGCWHAMQSSGSCMLCLLATPALFFRHRRCSVDDGHAGVWQRHRRHLLPLVAVYSEAGAQATYMPPGAPPPLPWFIACSMACIAQRIGSAEQVQ